MTAVDIADVALERARAHAETLDPEVGARIAWIVTSHYVHPSASRELLVRWLPERPGWHPPGRGHHPSDPPAIARPAGPPVRFTAEELAAVLDLDVWDILTCDVGSRSIVRPRGGETALRDTVLRALRR